MTIDTTTTDGVTVLALDGDALGGPDGSAVQRPVQCPDGHGSAPVRSA